MPADSSAAPSSRLHGDINGPADGTSVTLGPQEVYGWAVDGHDPVTGVVINVNGKPRVVAITGRPRPDVPEYFGNADVSEKAGWSGQVDLTDKDGTLIELSATALRADGTSAMVGRSLVRVANPQPGKPSGDFELPQEGATVHGTTILVKGWVLFGECAASRVCVEVAGQPWELARTHVGRPDIAQELRAGAAPVSGFEHSFVIPHNWSAPRDIEISIIAYAPDGNSWRPVKRTLRWMGVQEPSQEDRDYAATLAALTTETLTRVPRRSSSKTRVLVFSRHLATTDAGRYLLGLLRCLQSREDMEVIVASPYDGPARSNLESLGIRVHITGPYPGVVDDARRLTYASNIAAYEGRVQELAVFARLSGADVAIIDTLSAWSAADAVQRAGIPTIWAIHEHCQPPDFFSNVNRINDAKMHPYVVGRAASALDGATALVFAAEETQRLFTPFSSEDRRLCVPYGIDTSETDAFKQSFDRIATRDKYRIPRGAETILFTGAFEAGKASTLLVSAFSATAMAYPQTLLILEGDDLHDENSIAIHEQVNRSGLRDRVRFVDSKPNLRLWYGMADLMVCTSDNESLPSSVLDAMAFGLPVIATRVGGLSELIDDCQTGWLIPPRDVDSLIAVLTRVLSMDRAEWRTVALQAAQRVRRDYDPSRYARDYAALITGLASNASANPQALLVQVRPTDLLDPVREVAGISTAPAGLRGNPVA